ncbi:hypothetical protein ABZ853_29175 [Streptomyces albidoflavus]
MRVKHIGVALAAIALTFGAAGGALADDRYASGVPSGNVGTDDHHVSGVPSGEFGTDDHFAS